MVGLDELEAAAAESLEALDRLLLPADRAIGGWPAVYLEQRQSRKLLHGQPVSSGDEAGPGLVRVYDSCSRFLGIGEVLTDGRLLPKRLFFENAETVE
jgi:tRNA pseudouridine55 synthase